MLKYAKIVFFSVQILLLSNLISYKDQKSYLKTFVIKTRSICKQTRNRQMYVTSLAINSNSLEIFEIIDSLRNLTSLSLVGNNLSEITGLNSLVNLKKLIIMNTKLEKINLMDLIHLEDLNLSDNNIKSITGLGDLSNLKYLSISKNPHSQIEDIQNLINLETCGFLRTNLPESKLEELNKLIKENSEKRKD